VGYKRKGVVQTTHTTNIIRREKFDLDSNTIFIPFIITPLLWNMENVYGTMKAHI
jgi:hypothetical protein